MTYVTELASRAMIYIPNFMKTGPIIQKLMEGERGIHRHTDSMVIA
jgi:hypothetical protein